MKKCFIFFVFLNIVSGFLLVPQANAIGLGGYLTGGAANYDWTYEEEEFNLEYTDKSELKKYGGGFILDTAVSKDQLFNYRLNLGYCRTEITSDNLTDVIGNDIHIYNSFGFRLVRTENFRFWLGPQIGFGFMFGKYEDI